MNRWTATGVVAAAVAVFAIGGASAASAKAPGGGMKMAATADSGPRLHAVGLTTDQRLVSFEVARPGKGRVLGRVTGLMGDVRLVGIDYRVQDGKLYGVGDAGGVYTIVTRGAKATKVSQLTVALSGTSFGVDFNPAADRLRIVSDAGQNLSHDVNAGGTTTSQTTLTVPPATTAATGITAASYTNNDLNADTGTTLYDINTTADQVVIQSPPNTGLLVAVGKLGVDAGTDAGFDIYAQVRSGRAVNATGYATLSVGGRSALYQVSLVTGQADRRGAFPRGWQVTDLALPLNQR